MSSRFQFRGYQRQRSCGVLLLGLSLPWWARFDLDAVRHDVRAHFRLGLALQSPRCQTAAAGYRHCGNQQPNRSGTRPAEIAARLVPYRSCSPGRAPRRAECQRHCLRHRFQPPQARRRDAILARAIARADRVVLFEWLAGRRERVVTPDGGDGGWTWVEQLQPPTEILASAAKALGPFPLPKIDQAAFEFWAFKSSAGDVPTTAAVALQLTALPVYDEWLAVLKEARAPGAEQLPAQAAELKEPKDIQQLMQTLRRMFQADASLQRRVGEVLDRDPWRGSRMPKRTSSSPRSLRSTPVRITITSTSMVLPEPSARPHTNRS